MVVVHHFFGYGYGVDFRLPQLSAFCQGTREYPP